jgi:hypothetical protein
MYSIKYLLRYAALLALPFLASCEKGLDTIICEDGSSTGPVVQPQAPDSLSALSRRFGAVRQILTYDPSQQNKLTGQKGTIITIPANAFVQPNGAPVTQPMNLVLREVYSKGDMVMTRTPTSSNGRLLESAGEIYLRPLDTLLRLAPQTQIQFQTARVANLASPDSMRLFTGTSGGSCFDWQLSFDPRSSLAPNASGYTGIISSTLFNTGIGWFNCDRFVLNVNPQPVVIDVAGSNIDPKTNTMAFVVFRSLNGTLQACTFSGPNTFTSSRAPGGSAISAVVIRYLDGKIYYGRQDGTVEAGIRFSPVMREISLLEFLTNLKTL